MKRMAANVVRHALSYCGLTLMTSQRFAQLSAAHAVLADVHSTASAYFPEKKLGNAGFSLNLDKQLAFLQDLS
jgi:hypothetical protein